MTAKRIDLMTKRLREQLCVSELNIVDESAKHAGHAGARDGRGHFRMRICADEFRNLSTLQRHRLVYDVLGDLMQTDIHALSITALDPVSLSDSSTHQQ